MSNLAKAHAKSLAAKREGKHVLDAGAAYEAGRFDFTPGSNEQTAEYIRNPHYQRGYAEAKDEHEKRGGK